MTLITSISGIRGTLGGVPGENLTPLDIIAFASAYATFIRSRSGLENPVIAIGRDGRTSGPVVSGLVLNTLAACGCRVIDLGLSTTPTVEMAVTQHNCQGGIIVTASHNPGQWNALKLLNEKGEFLSGKEGEEVLNIAHSGEVEYVKADQIGEIEKYDSAIDDHIQAILKLPLVKPEIISQANFSVALDAVNSTGGIAVPRLLEALGVKRVTKLNCEPNGLFAHNPEPLPAHLFELIDCVRNGSYQLGIAVDPDVDRLAFVSEDGGFFGEEYTIVAVADYVLQHTPGNTVSNLSSSRALSDITLLRKGSYEASAVGEVNVVEKMKSTNAIIGGEGNGGVIYPELHYGRDALVGIALFLTYLAESGLKASEIRKRYPAYYMAKNKLDLPANIDVDALLLAFSQKFPVSEVNTVDGVKIDKPEGWVHLRKSNTEPIIRLYTESGTPEKASQLADDFMTRIKEMIP